MEKQSKLKRTLPYILPPVVTVIAILIVYYVKALYPFDTGTIMDNDWGAAEFPGLLRFWDIIHGNISVFYDWSTGTGLPKSSFCAFFDIFNWFLLLFKRDFLYNAMNYLFIAKMTVISVTSFVFFKNIFKKLPLVYTYLFTFAFTFSGYCLQYYTNISWLSFIAVFPLLALALINMLNGKGFVPFVIALAYCFIISTYFTYFTLISIILIGTAYIFAFLEKDKRPHAAFQLGMGTVSSALISFFAIFIFVSGTLTSSRFQMNNNAGFLNSVIEILKTKNIENAYKYLMLLGMELGAFALVMLFIKFKKTGKKAFFFLFSSLIFILPVIFNNIDYMWNGGNYNGYPMRYGFLYVFVFCCMGAYYFSELDTYDKSTKNLALKYLIPTLCIIALYITIPIYITYTSGLKDVSALNNNGKMLALSYLYTNGIAFLLVLACVFIFQLIGNKKLRTTFICCLMAFVIGMNSYCLIGAREGQSSGEPTEQYILDSYSLNKEISDEDCFNRIQNSTAELSMNYPSIVMRSAVSDWTHIIDGNLRKSISELGYGMSYTYLTDTGSTVFGNSLMCVNNTLSKQELDQNLYTKERVLSNGYIYYDNNFKLPFGLEADASILDAKYDDNSFNYQNEIYNSLGGEGELFTSASLTSTGVTAFDSSYTSLYDSNYEFAQTKYTNTFSFHVGEKSTVYFTLDDGSVVYNLDLKVTDCIITVNGEELAVPDFFTPYNKAYRISFNNNLLSLGTFENEDVTVTLTSTSEKIDKPIVYLMPHEKMRTFCNSTASCVTDYTAGKRSLSITANGESGKYLFVPVYNAKGWQCTVNGEKTEIKTALGSFMAIPLQNGENTIKMKYVPTEFYVSLVISIVSLAVFVAVMLIIKKKKPSVPKKTEKLFLALLCAVSSLAVIVIYITPLIAQVYYAVVGRK